MIKSKKIMGSILRSQGGLLYKWETIVSFQNLPFHSEVHEGQRDENGKIWKHHKPKTYLTEGVVAMAASWVVGGGGVARSLGLGRAAVRASAEGKRSNTEWIVCTCESLSYRTEEMYKVWFVLSITKSHCQGVPWYWHLKIWHESS